MYDSGKVITGLTIFALVVMFPVWYNVVNGAGHTPEPQKPTNTKNCVAEKEFMRTSHMKLLNDWRDEVVRSGDRKYISVDGVNYQKSLQNGCMNCHANKTKFCDECHTYAAVKPYCWDCHVQPKEMN